MINKRGQLVLQIGKNVILVICVTPVAPVAPFILINVIIPVNPSIYSETEKFAQSSFD